MNKRINNSVINNTIYLPNKHGNYQKVKIPAYLNQVLYDYSGKPRIRQIGVYEYILRGINQYRVAYGIYNDIELLKKFLNRFSKFDDGNCIDPIQIISFHMGRNNYHVKFNMFDPYALAMEKSNLICF